MNLTEIETPSVLIDLDIVENNIDKYQSYCNKKGINLRPHIKTHKIPELANLQLKAGAIGVTCQKISEAEAMISEGGIDDILITFNIFGQKKLDRLRILSGQVKLSVVADNIQCIQGLSETFKNEKSQLTVLVECDTGALRCGVVTPREACELAKKISSLPGLSFGGLMTYPPISQSEKINNFLGKAKDLIEASGIPVPVISIGGSPNMWEVEKIPLGTEYRIGTYIYNDRSLMERSNCLESDCGLTILATVISTPEPHRAVIDAGSKVLTSDLFGLKGHGYIIGFPKLSISNLSEEHGCIIGEGETGLKIGQKVRIIPNHACVVSNMMDEVMFIRGDTFVKKQPVVARGQVL